MSQRSTFPRHEQRPSLNLFGMNDRSSRAVAGSPMNLSLDNLPRPMEMDPSKSHGSIAATASSPVAGDSFPDAPPFKIKFSRGGNWPTPHPYALEQFYGNRHEDPWIPPGIVAPRPEDSRGSRSKSNWPPKGHAAPPLFSPWRSASTLPSECDTQDNRGAIPSDSGYGTRHSESTSVFGDMDRSYETQSLVGQFDGFGMTSPEYARDANLSRDQWPLSSRHQSLGDPAPSHGKALICPECKKSCKTKSELNKHDQRHKKPNVCDVQGCPRVIQGFGTSNDLDRHKRSCHPDLFNTPGNRFVCSEGACANKDKVWPRADNFRSHLKRVHHIIVSPEEDLTRFVYKSPNPFPPVLEGVGSSVGYYAPFDNGVGEPLASAWTLQRPADLDLGQGRSPNMDPQMDRSVAAMQFTEAFPQAFPEVPEQALEQDQTIPSGSSLPVTSVELEAPAPPSQSSKIASSRFSDRRDDEPQEPAVVRDTRPPAVQSSDAPREVENQQSKATTEPVVSNSLRASESSTISSDSSSQSPATVLPEKTMPRTSPASSSGTPPCVPTKDPASGETDSHIPESPKSDVDERSSGNGSTPENHDDDDEPQKTQSSGASELLGSVDTMDLDDEEKALRFLEKLKKEGRLEKLFKKVNNPPAKKTGASPPPQTESYSCNRCRKTFPRRCELKKHLKRHDKPYGCTFPHCTKKFGSKNDWKRHENGQHFQLEVWKCDEKPLANQEEPCGKVCHRRETFKHHLQKDHNVDDAKQLEEKIERCRIGRSCDNRFWCGFCQQVIEVNLKGPSVWTERFNHIDNHFSGRNAPKKEIEDWKNVDADLPDADLSPGPEEPRRSPQPDQHGQVDLTRAALSSTDAGDVQSKKRKSEGDGSQPNEKRARKDECIMWTCCQCNGIQNLQTNASCVSLSGNCEHRNCNDCIKEYWPNLDDGKAR